ncbi:MAG: hypothetical protein CMH49_07265 [Myxococcales bacterium]|nr:hypothetical protein [Myxococcales bacterium]
MSDESTPAPSIAQLSSRSQKLLGTLLQSRTQDISIDDYQIEDVLDSLKSDLDGQTLVVLEESLDWLRDAGLYEISVPLLEESWSADLPLDFLGRVAQDWVGSVLFGLGDETGAREVATHISKRARELGPSFCCDLCDMYLEWGFFKEAESLAQFVHEKQPGEVSALFHLMICAKMRLAWTEAQTWLEKLDGHRGQDATPEPSIEWNRALFAVAQHHWSKARQAWRAVGFQFPEQSLEEQTQDYATSGELSPVRLKIDSATVEASRGQIPRSEVVWGHRIGPARVELSGIPYYHPTIRSGDILLIDGVKEGNVELDGDTYPVSPALSVWASSPGETFRLYGVQKSLKAGIMLDRFTQELGEDGWAIVNWTRMIRKETKSREPLIQVALYLPPERDITLFHLKLAEFMSEEDAPQLYSPRYASLTNEDVQDHQQAWRNLGLKVEETH